MELTKIKASLHIREKGNINILMSSKPPPQFRLSPTLITDCINDPVFAATFFFKERLDEFQKVRLKIFWFTPRTMDSSGFSSAKTKNLWMVSNLRCLLFENHVGGVYYQVFSTGQKTYWNYYYEVASRSPWFRHHVGKRRIVGLDGKTEEEGKATLKGPSCWTCDYRNGSQIMMPAAGFMQDAKTQASIRLNDLWIDEWTKIMASGSEGIDDQLIGRVTKACFNKDHPVWCNHMGFLATAEDTMHPAYARKKAFEEEVRKGNPDYYHISFSYKDYSDREYKNGRSFAQVFREDKTILDLRKNKGLSGFRQEGLGIWSLNGTGLYTPEMIQRAYNIGAERKVDILVSRREESEPDKEKLAKVHYFLGVDPAKSETLKADDGTMAVLRVRPLIEKPTSNIEDWAADFVWAYRIPKGNRKLDTGHWSGLIHRKHQQFNFTGIMMDGGSGGGGNWIRPELGKTMQNIRGTPTKCRPIACQEDEATMVTADFVLAMFKRGDDKLDRFWEDQNVRGDDNLIDNAHKDFWTGLHLGVIGLPKVFKARKPNEVELWSDERRYANILIELGARQLNRISVQTKDDGSIYYTSHNARSFSARGKKDFAYAMVYAYTRFLMWVKNFEDQESDSVPEADADQCL